MSRRDAYLFAWGLAYASLSLSFALRTPGPLWPLWIVLFGTAAAVTLTSSIVSHRRLQAAAFSGLLGVAAVRGVWYLTQAVTTGGRSQGTFAILWVAVAAAQFIVAGWPEPVGRTPKEQDNEC